MSTEGSVTEEPLENTLKETNTPADALNLVFRFRNWLHILIFGIAFAISWTAPGGGGARRVWLTLPEAVSAQFRIDLGSAIVALTILATLLAIAAAVIRTWATAYLGRGVVFSSDLDGSSLIILGPYRYVRNPLYLGTMLHTLALCVLMTWQGAVFAVFAMAALHSALIASEERYHLAQGRPGYVAFFKGVPRIIPRLSPVTSESGIQPRWGQAVAGEIYMWGVAVSFAAFGFTYNARLIEQGVLVSFGLSVMLRGLTAKR